MNCFIINLLANCSIISLDPLLLRRKSIVHEARAGETVAWQAFYRLSMKQEHTTPLSFVFFEDILYNTPQTL